MDVTHTYSPEKVLAKKFHKEHRKMQMSDGGWGRSAEQYPLSRAACGTVTGEEKYPFTFIRGHLIVPLSGVMLKVEKPVH